MGIATFVLHNREHLAVIKPYENAIILNELRYAHELKKTENLNIPKTTTAPNELDIALKLIDHLTTKFHPLEYKDTYTDDIQEMIEKKAKGKKVTPTGHEVKRPSKVQDLMSLLKASLEEEQQKQSPKKTRTTSTRTPRTKRNAQTIQRKKNTG